MTISLDAVSKRFLKHLIFSKVSCRFELPGSYALLGANGSGKSTLMRIIAGMQSPSKGSISYTYDGAAVAPEHIHALVSFCAPGMELPEELTLTEFLDFHFRFKKRAPGWDVPAIIAATGLQYAAREPIANFSSGMKQRVKLAQAFFADTPLLLLDEPCTNLDHHGVSQYREWIAGYTRNRLVIVASNDEREYDFCKILLKMDDYKPASPADLSSQPQQSL